MQRPLVTIVTPSLNQGRFLRATIESVLAQDYPAIEYIIMDGGSSDDSAGIAGDYASRLTFISEPDRGQSHAINKGFRRGRGEILAWINADDLLLPGATSAAAAALSDHPEAPAVYGEGDRIDEDGRRLGRFPFTEPFHLWKLVHHSDYILQQSLFLRRKALDEAGYLDEELHYTMDWDLLIRLGLRAPLHYIPKRLGAIREHRSAKSFRGGRRRIAEIARLLRRRTGRRFPPGLILYALETWRGPFPVHSITGRWIDRLREAPGGLYRDGWAGPKLDYMVPPGESPIRIRGLAPAAQRLSVMCNGRSAGEHEVGRGEFEMLANEAALATLEIRASLPGPRCWVVRSIDRRQTLSIQRREVKN